MADILGDYTKILAKFWRPNAVEFQGRISPGTAFSFSLFCEDIAEETKRKLIHFSSPLKLAIRKHNEWKYFSLVFWFLSYHLR